MPEEDSAAVSARRRAQEQRFIRDRTHVDGLTPGTVVEYDDWQWAIITEIDEDYEPSKVGLVLLDQLGDNVINELEPAWGCAEHYAVIEEFRGGEHEYWTDTDYIPENDIWSVRGPVHPDERDDEPELVTDGGETVGQEILDADGETIRNADGVSEALGWNSAAIFEAGEHRDGDRLVVNKCTEVLVLLDPYPEYELFSIQDGEFRGSSTILCMEVDGVLEQHIEDYGEAEVVPLSELDSIQRDDRGIPEFVGGDNRE